MPGQQDLPSPAASTDVFAGPVTPPSDIARQEQAAGRTAYAVIIAVGFCHFLNDLMQTLFPAVYPAVKTELNLSYAQVGLITLMWQATAAVLQPLVGYFNDRHPRPYALALSVLFVGGGVFLLAVAPTYSLVLFASAIVGVGSSVFHPEASRIARLGAGTRPGLAQSVFQVGGNFGQACGPLFAALVGAAQQRAVLAWFALLGAASGIVLFNLGRWHKRHGQLRNRLAAQVRGVPSLTRRQRITAIAILLALIFSKFVYLASLTSYYPLYLIARFDVSVESSQTHLFVFLAAVAAGTLIGGPLGDRFGRRRMIWFSILGVFPFAFLLPHADLFWTGILTVVIGLILSSAFSTIVVYGQQIVPGNIGAISGLFFGFSFGMGGLGAVGLGYLADLTSIATVYQLCAFLPLIGLLTAFLPDLADHRAAR
jgi:FSR family fosmidomycin resistance protein-like MFS transporter